MLASQDHLDKVLELLQTQWTGQPTPPASLLEQRVMELEYLGMQDVQEIPEMPSSIRQFAIASLHHHKPDYFVTADSGLLNHRSLLEGRYGVEILSIPEAVLLLHAVEGPVD